MSKRLSHDFLKAIQREKRDGFSENLSLRVHRALSWFKRFEIAVNDDIDDLDAQFIFLWVAFNAAYSQDTDASQFTESQSFQHFIEKLCALDDSKDLYQLLWSEFTSSIRLLIDNKFVFQPFWDHHNNKISETEWRSRFTSAKSRANRALSDIDSPTVLMIVLSRLYTLRNQLVHGGATWNSRANREQLRDAVSFLSKLVPLLINIMMNNPDTLWGDANYPLIDP